MIGSYLRTSTFFCVLFSFSWGMECKGGDVWMGFDGCLRERDWTNGCFLNIKSNELGQTKT